MNPGNILIALPSIIGNIHFHRSIIFLVECKMKSTFGFIINKKLDYNLNDLVEGLKPTIPLYFGGPVEPENLFFMHTLGAQIPKSIPIDNTYFWSGDFDTIIELLNQNETLVKEIRFFLGYSGWDENQLQNEINSEAWHLKTNNYESKLFQFREENLWREQMIALGGKYVIWANAPNNPNSN